VLRRKLGDQITMNHRRWCWQHNQAAIRGLRESRDRASDVGSAAHVDMLFRSIQLAAYPLHPLGLMTARKEPRNLGSGISMHRFSGIF
jgi:hypothetical protein